ncbi:MAG: PilC/PilY family type IV pilus protein [Burkholderiaceae bacterium]
MNRHLPYIFGLVLSFGSAAAVATPSQFPLLSRDGNEGKPNVIYTIDDSGSMDWQFMPDDMWGGLPGTDVYRMGFDPAENNSWPFSRSGFVATELNDLASGRYRSSAINRVYYDPTIRYLPWANSDGSFMPDSNPNNAFIEPLYTWLGSANLSGSSNVWARWCTWYNCSNRTLNYAPATYYDYNGNGVWNSNNFTRVRIIDFATFVRPNSRSDCPVNPLNSAENICTQQQELQNFANWFTYYRRRVSTSIAATSRAFSEQGDGLRVGYGRINKGSSTVDGVSTRSVERGVRTFSGSDRQNYFNWLHARIGNGGTPLRYSMDGVGQYFMRADNRGPWGETPGTNDNTAHLACRKSYHIIMSDGYWNGPSAPTWQASANVDNQNGPNILGPGAQSYQYLPVPPFKSDQGDSLADIAMYYWNRDLRPDLVNRVRPDVDNPAFWQNLVQFTVGLGVGGALDPATDLPGLTSGATAWTNIWTNPGKIDDMWHAAINSRGRFLSASNPDQFATALGGILQSISERESAEGGSAVSSITLETTSAKYIPTYKSGSWSGDVQAKRLDNNGVAIADLWRASDVLPLPASRNIHVGQGGSSSPVPFNWATMPPGVKAQMSPLMDADMVAYIRGDRSLEGAQFRVRDPDSVLGDMVNSLPTLIGGLTDEQYNFLPSNIPGASGYKSFVEWKKNQRTPVLFVGGNDGMLHAFRATDGVETFAFIPNTVLPKLHEPSQLAYSHKFMVDGPITEADAFSPTGQWKNYLLSSLGAGGRAVFAMDVTDTSNLGPSSVQWEFTHPDLGYVMSPVSVGVLPNGDWAAFFGNGYDSDNGRAKLFIVNLFTGNLITPQPINTSVGGNNGLGGVRLVKNLDNVVVAAYAGDRRGNLWRFDLQSTNPAQWKVGFNGSPLFTTHGGDNQSITGQPEYITHPKGGQLIIMGTGRLYEDADLTDANQQALYGIWDPAPATLASNTSSPLPPGAPLHNQAFGPTVQLNGTDYIQMQNTGALDWTAVRGWKLPLTLGTTGTQRSVYPPQLVRGYVLFNTVAPGAATGQACDDSKAIGFNVLINALTGGSPAKPIFDTDGSLDVDSNDLVTAGYQTAADGIDRIMLGTGGKVSFQRAFGQTTGNIDGRSLERSWRQLLNPPN